MSNPAFLLILLAPFQRSVGTAAEGGKTAAHAVKKQSGRPQEYDWEPAFIFEDNKAGETLLMATRETSNN